MHLYWLIGEEITKKHSQAKCNNIFYVSTRKIVFSMSKNTITSTKIFWPRDFLILVQYCKRSPIALSVPFIMTILHGFHDWTGPVFSHSPHSEFKRHSTSKGSRHQYGVKFWTYQIRRRQFLSTEMAKI